ncbi:MAG: GNAT family N-acetyltransferase [Armatimonadetes bacterium]|nr:GNAT family N-acetyltransferase [Armatimonadota bacterium]
MLPSLHRERQTNLNARVRPAALGDGAAIFRVLMSAFNLEEGSAKYRHIERVALDAAERFLCLEMDNDIVGVVMVSPHWLRIGLARILKADVGEVAVLKEFQGRGLGTHLMESCVLHLEEQGYDLSRLGGLNRFYSRFGYVPFPRRYFEFLLTEARAGTGVIQPEAIVALTSEEDQCLRPYVPKSDWQRRNELYDAFNAGRTGSLVEERSPNPPTEEADPEALRWVYETGGEVRGYLFAVGYAEEPSPFEARVTIHDVAFDIDHPESLVALVKRALQEALRRGAQRATARLPFDPRVEQALTDAALPYSLRELQSTPASNMLLLVSLSGLLENLTPELMRRYPCSVSCPPFEVRFNVGDQCSTLAVNDTSLRVCDEDRTEARVTCEVTAFLRWVLGVNGFGEWQVNVRHTLTDAQFTVLSHLFRREPCASGPWG